MKSDSKRLILVLGPTAVGKTDKAIELAKSYQCPIISCDSRQVYKELNIGVAKPDKSQLDAVKHYFISHVSIHQSYDAGKFAEEARNLSNELFETHDTIVVCGGTGLYVKAFVEGLDSLPAKDESLREELNELLKSDGLVALQQKLRSMDEERYHKTEILNPQRLIRAIEIAMAKTNHNSELPAFKHQFITENLILQLDRPALYDRINRRVDNMIDQGLEEEARAMYPHRHLNALQTVGYKEWWPYFEGEYNRETAIDKIKQHTRNYAKRQITWFKKSHNDSV